MGAEIRYTATLYQEQTTSDDATDIEVTVIEDVRGGISGPAVSFTLDTTDLDTVDLELARHHFTRTSGWRLGNSFQGMQLICDVTPA